MDPNLIFDIGGFHGQDADFYLKKGFNVVTIEANPQFAEKIRQSQAKALQTGALTLIVSAISPEAGSLEFFVHDHGDWSSLYKTDRFQEGTYKTVRVASITADELFRRFAVPYYVKIDIEGADQHVIDAICRLKSHDMPRYVSYELGPDTEDAEGQLGQVGYNRFKLVEQNTLPSVILREPSLEGLYVPYRFTGYHSGPFGEEAPGLWMTCAELRDAQRAIDWTQGYARWFDVHARFGR